jgi:NTE family protein
MTKRKPRIAFVASGGAVKGITHLGVLRAAEELGIHFDILVGSSAGAMIASVYGQGVSIDKMVDQFRPVWKRRFAGPHLGLWTFVDAPSRQTWEGWRYLTSGISELRGFERFMCNLLPRNDFRSIEKEIYVTATDIDTTERVVFGRGFIDHVPMSLSVAASCCLPILFRPVKIDGRYFVDGETKKTLSVDIAILRGADVVVVSNVYNPHVTPAGEMSVAHRGIGQVAMQSGNIVIHEKAMRGLDLWRQLYPHVKLVVVEPDVGHLPFVNSMEARRFLKAGYLDATKRLTEAKAQGVFGDIEESHAYLKAL